MAEQHKIESEVTRMLTKLDAESLQCAYGILELDVPESKKGNQYLLFKNLVRHLNSEEVEAREDGGLEFFQKLHGFLIKHFQTPEKKPDEKFLLKQELADSKLILPSDLKLENHSPPPRPQTTEAFFQKLKDFKISGCIGGSGEKDKLSYTSLAYQIQNGRKAGYSDDEICAGVIRSIAPGNYLRSYLESKSSLNVLSLIQIMRSHFSEKDSSSTLTEMSNSVQSVNESTYDFVVKLMSKREKVLILAKEEDCPYDESLVQRRFLHAISTGIRNNNIRNDLRHVLQNVNISDEHLLQHVSEVVVNNSERNEKLAQSKKDMRINQINTDPPQDNPLLVEIRKIQSEHSDQMAAFRSEILQIKQAVSHGHASDSKQGLPRRAFRCPNCTVTKSRCTHCFVCGSADHKKSACPHKDSKN